MAADTVTYSRFISLLKIVLSLLALGLLSTLFLVQRNIGNNSDGIVPFADVELEKRLKNQQITAPFFSGKTSDGHLVAFNAETAQPNVDDAGHSEASKIDAQIDLADGSRLTMSSELGVIDNKAHEATLMGEVTLTSSNGYTLTSQRLISGMRELEIRSPGEVLGTGPAGDFTAGKMHVLNDIDEDAVYLFFTNGVKLIYTPKK